MEIDLRDAPCGVALADQTPDRKYVVTPMALVAELRPTRVVPSHDRPRSASSYKATELSVTTNFAAAERGWLELIDHYLRRFRSGEVEAIYHLLDRSPEYLRDDRVRAALLEAEQHQRTRGRPRGRSHLSRTLGPIIVIVVDCRSRQERKSRERVFTELAQDGFEDLDYYRIRQLYYQFRNDTRFIPFLVRFDELAEIVDSKDLSAAEDRLVEDAARKWRPRRPPA